MNLLETHNFTSKTVSQFWVSSPITSKNQKLCCWHDAQWGTLDQFCVALGFILSTDSLDIHKNIMQVLVHRILSKCATHTYTWGWGCSRENKAPATEDGSCIKYLGGSTPLVHREFKNCNWNCCGGECLFTYNYKRWMDKKAFVAAIEEGLEHTDTEPSSLLMRTSNIFLAIGSCCIL